jgi:hypothetical protein
MRVTAHHAHACRLRQSRAIAGALSHTLLSLAQRLILHGLTPLVRRGILPVRQTHNCGDREAFETLPHGPRRIVPFSPTANTSVAELPQTSSSPFAPVLLGVQLTPSKCQMVPEVP